MNAQTKTIASKKPVITVSINPVYQIVSAIAKEKAEINLIIKPTFSEHNYLITHQDMLNIDKSDIVLYVSRNLEAALHKYIKSSDIRNKSIELIEIGNLRLIESHNNRNINDVHIWLNTNNIIRIADFIKNKLIDLDKSNSIYYTNNFIEFREKIIDFRRQTLTSDLKLTSGKYILSHDGYRYFSEEFETYPAIALQYSARSDIKFSEILGIKNIINTGKVSCILYEPRGDNSGPQMISQKFNINLELLDGIGVSNQTFIDMLRELKKSLTKCTAITAN